MSRDNFESLFLRKRLSWFRSNLFRSMLCFVELDELVSVQVTSDFSFEMFHLIFCLVYYLDMVLIKSFTDVFLSLLVDLSKVGTSLCFKGLLH